MALTEEIIVCLRFSLQVSFFNLNGNRAVINLAVVSAHSQISRRGVSSSGSRNSVATNLRQVVASRAVPYCVPFRGWGETAGVC